MNKNVHRLAQAIACLLVSAHITYAQLQSPVLRSVAPNQPIAKKTTSKLSADLRGLYMDFLVSTGKAKEKIVDPSMEGSAQFMQRKGDKVLVNVTVTQPDDAKIKEGLESLGLEVTGMYGRIISGMISIDALPKFESAAGVRLVRPAYKAMQQRLPDGVLRNGLQKKMDISPVIGQGDTAQRSYLARRNYHVNGKGVKVGILSDSYNSIGGAAAGVLAGELPGSGNPFGLADPVEVLEDFIDPSNTDEGRGMAEIVHDVAPGARLAFHTAFLGEADFAQGILDLADAGCGIIVDDVYYFDEPYFQDGIVAQAVDKVYKKGVTYFSAAGNQSNLSYESEYRSTSISPFGSPAGTLHNFSKPGDPIQFYFQPIIVRRGETFVTCLQWDQSSYSASGVGPESDIDVYLLNSDGKIVDFGADDNIYSGEPAEFLFYTNNTNQSVFWIAILKYSGPDPGFLKYIMFGNGGFYPGLNPDIPGVKAPTIYGHAKAAGAIATAAAPWFQTPAYGVTPPVVEPYSSLGGVPTYLDIKGNRIRPEIRKKPELTAPDGGNTSFFYQDSRADMDTYPNFFGTSAAAPHAAGVAALMIEAQKLNTLTPDQIKSVLTTNTVDMDNPLTPGFDAGFDYATGAGLLKADDAVGAVYYSGLLVKNLNLEPVLSGNKEKNLKWKIINPNAFALKAHWSLVGYNQSDDLTVRPGETMFTSAIVTANGKPIPNTVLLEWKDNLNVVHGDRKTNTGTDSRADIAALTKGRIDAPALGQLNIAEVSPNPSSANFRLYLSLNGTQNADIELFGIDGKSLYKKVVLPKGVVDIDSKTLNPGIYILKVKQGTFSKSMQIVKN